MTKKLLLVDDDQDVIISFRRGLEDNGYEVDAYTDPLLTLSNFKADLYDLAILDVRMPQMDGFELYERMKKIDNKVKVCFITAFEVNYEALREVFSSSETECFIRKPIEVIELVQHVKGELVQAD